MPNMRVLFDNVADIASLSTTNNSTTMVATNLLSDRKSKVARSTSASAWQIVVSFTSSKMINMVALAFTNLTSTATMQVRGYTNLSDTVGVTSPAFTVAAAVCAPAPFVTRADEQGKVLGGSVTAFGMSSYAARYFTGGTVAKIAIDLVDSSNPAGYMEAARLICGQYWEPTYNADYGLTWSMPDNTKTERNDAGDAVSERGFRYKKITLQLSQMPTADRRKFMDMVQVNGALRPVFLSVFPENTETDREQKYMIYGKLSGNLQATHPFFNLYSFPIEIEEL